MPGAHGAALTRPRAARRKPQAALPQLEEEVDQRESAWAVSNGLLRGKGELQMMRAMTCYLRKTNHTKRRVWQCMRT